VAEHLHDDPDLGARTLFATHYHELAELARGREGVRNGHFEAREWGEEVLFLRRLVPGEASRSYGIQVARLAGLPAPVIARAREVLQGLEANEAEGGGAGAHERAGDTSDQLSLFAGTARDPRADAILGELRQLDPERVTPLDALGLLARWQAQLIEADETAPDAEQDPQDGSDPA
jgi:DNA mismatch repair protein MutS